MFFGGGSHGEPAEPCNEYKQSAPEPDEGAPWRFVKLSALFILAYVVVRQAHHDTRFQKGMILSEKDKRVSYTIHTLFLIIKAF